MALRQRRSRNGRANGTWWFNNNPSGINGGGLTLSEYANCDDWTGLGDCAPFSVDSRSTSGGVINKFSNGVTDSQFRDYIADWLGNIANGGHLFVSGVPSNAQASTSAVARTNPSRPYVDVPVNILDIREKPRRILEDIQDLRRRGFWRAPPRPSPRDLRRGVGNAWLQYQFMIAPIVGDIVKLANATDQINRRIKAINQLFHGHGIRRTVSTFDGSAQLVQNQTVQSAGVFINVQFTANTSVIQKVHTRWSPTTECGLQPSPEQVRAWAVRAVMGLTVDLSTIWEITPWSWLADWFSDVGTFLKASRNIIPAQLTGVYPMTHFATRWNCADFISPPVSMSGISVKSELKNRVQGFVAPTFAGLNFLSGNQMGILAALVASR